VKEIFEWWEWSPHLRVKGKKEESGELKWKIGDVVREKRENERGKMGSGEYGFDRL
jgi:hypothetical protein